MPLSQPTRRRSITTLVQRVILCLCALVMALQLVSSSFHDHDLADQLSDCVSCHVSSHSHAALPSVAPELLATFLAVAYLIARLPRPALVVLRRYLIPARQAPPRPYSAH